MSNEQRAQNELVLSPGEFGLVQDVTTGLIKVITGPNVLNVSGQEYPVSFDAKTQRYHRVSLSEAPQQFVMAQQGQYIVLSNPAISNSGQPGYGQPEANRKVPAAALSIGQRIIIQGPATFALWPGQSAEVIDGHNLRSNQYLRIRIRDEQMARDNWTKGVIKAISSTPELAGTESTDAKAQKDKGKGTKASKAEDEARKTMFDEVPADLAVGKHYIVRGDEFSFYIPPTGVEVVMDETGGYVRDAITLERLEYCILIDENGNKRYERGPRVVFPLPTERFYEESDKGGKRHVVFQPIELNEIQGIHIKVISDYTDEDGIAHKEGDELFIRGDKTPIYFPRPEHSLVTYDRKHKSFATAVPAGAARYVLERKTGVINMLKGPTMLLPDPRSQVIVRRVLTDKQSKLWYPGNLEVERYNSALRELSRGTSSTRGAVTEGEIERSKKIRSAPVGASNALGFADRSTTHSDTNAIGMDEMERGASYNEPRTLTLDNHIGGVPTIDIWTGYAVMVVTLEDNAPIKRRVEMGPKRLYMEYDETLETLSMSTGKPKSTDTLIQTVYLRVKNNQVGDIIRAETKDHVSVEFKVSLRGDFTGDPDRWFEAENYVKLVSDHVRSVVKAAIRQRTIEELYADPTSALRDAILGTKASDKGRPGMLFEENGFHLLDVDVLGFTVGDDRISTMLNNTQHQVVESNIALALAEKKLALDKRTEELNRERSEAKAATARFEQTLQSELQKFSHELKAEEIERNLKLQLAELEARAAQLKKQEEAQAEEQRLFNERQNQELARKKQQHDLDTLIAAAVQDLGLAKTAAETKAVIDRFQAGSGTFAEALIAVSSQETMARVAEAMGIQNYIGGPNLVTALKSVFSGTPLEGLVGSTLAKALPAKNGAEKAPRGS